MASLPVIRNATVPCESIGCVACCKFEAVFVEAAYGDDPSQYDTIRAGDDPLFAGSPLAEKRMIRHQADGSCVYLRGGLCSIYERRPGMCRHFDCREYVKTTPREHQPMEYRMAAFRLAKLVKT